MQRIYDFLKKAGVYYLATVDGYQARVRPFGTIKIVDDKLCFLTGKTKSVSKQIHANPNVELSAFVEGQWIRVQAIAVEDPRVESQSAMLEGYPELKKMYAPGDGNTEVFKLDRGVAVISSFTEAPITIEF